jgi:hypothetical protein
MEANFNKEEKYLRAKKRVKEVKGFYIHLYVYILINGFITLSKIISEIQDGSTLQEAVWDFSFFDVWFFWGIGLAIHAINVFGIPFLFGKDWEDKKLKQFMNEDNDQFNSI